ncbi:undecaprenyldiphospho-muramoylpentapeptide beta-N-acetylglucosaminyltransferase [Spongiibacter nanhainus]|uniref:UDP-N-acetylglucosamine--N-acetylmuramyl-(pentapeptide) pyrophosphoryl-undecaprenol N-acetylglucosamine transferase n=1 Tax=Spongiibacter nanhainus TaxID=2794344 RepID=A0A7T4UR20_9GAMM|nr:undecaprenyldiphospho-muramoylpentapeptide beta-N-acetylglucosaminyltransferase [Spongiibacter nanhainus]QQD19072.1 undecaprenyldiphospho-muramoylpentapeptide beta-N-acetylglucosaminyltransferase [Spongiibacter nanhainus]
MATELRVLMMAGGTGGHVFPALAVAEELRDRGVDVQWLGTNTGIEARLVPAANITLHTVNMAGLRGKSPLSRLTALWKAFAAVWQCLGLLRRLKPFCVVGMGGYASGPGGLAARLLGIPVVIHEQNAVAGTTNRLLAKMATLCMTGYPIDLGGRKNRYIGNPVRNDIAAIAPPAERWQGREGPLRVLVLGGSQGAKAINDAVVETWISLPEAQRPALWHQAGAAHADAVAARYAEAGVKVLADAFIDDMAAAYAWADLVLCRAGALTVAELAAVGVPAILVPLPNAIDDHQRANARWLAEGGAGEILDQSELSVATLSEVIGRYRDQRASLLAMAEAGRKLARPQAAADAAEQCMEFAHGH